MDSRIANKLAGSASLKAGNWDAAVEYFKKNLVDFPEDVESFIDMAQVFIQNPYGVRNCFELAYTLLEDALKLEPNNIVACIKLFQLSKKLTSLENAAEWLNRAEAINPEDLNFLFEKSQFLADIGKIDEAIASWHKVLSIRPFYPSAIYNLFFLKKFSSPDDVDLLHAKKILESKQLTPYEKQCMSFALFKAHDDLKDFAVAASYLTEANQIAQSLSTVDLDRELLVMKKFSSIFSQKLIDEMKPKITYDSSSFPTPIFIVSMPRSGSTLLESIVSSHRLVTSAGEPFYLKQSCDDLRWNPEGDCALEESPEILAQRAINYLSLLKQHAPSGSKYIIDKLPLNFIFIGFIKLVLPQAKIIYIQRDPCAVAFSCYKHMFQEGQSFSFSTEGIVKYYENHKQIMKYWKDDLEPGSFLEIVYKDLVSDFEATLKRVFDYCELEMQESCEKFYESNNVIRSASLVQVRQPIYKGSNDSWKNYQEYFPEFFEKISKL